MAEEHEQIQDTFNAGARGHWLSPLDLNQFLELLRNNGNVSMSARLIGRSRSTIYAFADQDGKIHVQPPSDRLLSQLIGGFFTEFRPGNKEERAPDELLPDSADLTQLSDADLEALEKILSKVSSDDVGARAG